MMSSRHGNNVMKDMEKLIRKNNLLVREIQDLKEDEINNHVLVDFLRDCLNQKNKRTVELEKAFHNQKEKTILCETDIKSKMDKIRLQKERIEDQGKTIQKQKKTIQMMKNSYAFLFGQAFVNALKKPGINTILLPYRWIRLTLRQWL